MALCKIVCVLIYIHLSIKTPKMLQFVYTDTCNEAQPKTMVSFCIKNINDEDNNIIAFISIYLNNRENGNCNCQSTMTECQCKDFTIKFEIPIRSFKKFGNNAFEYIKTKCRLINNQLNYNEFNNNEIINNQFNDNNAILFDLNGFMEGMQLLQLPKLTTSMLAEFSPKYMVYNYVIYHINMDEYMIQFENNFDNDYLESNTTNEIDSSCSFEDEEELDDLKDEDPDDSYYSTLAKLKDKYLWILEDEEFDKEKLDVLESCCEIPLVETIQDVEKAYNKLYSILVEYENPNGLLK